MKIAKKILLTVIIIEACGLILILLISAVMMIGDCGKEETTLNEWQKEFLAEQGLPTEYSELNFTQKVSVDAIYEMIMYLQDKYGIEFEYTGYVRPQILEREHLTAIPKGGNKKTDTVTVTYQDDGTLTDDYPNVAVRPYYEQMITDYVKDYFGSDKVRVFSTVTDTSIKDFNDISVEKMKGNIHGNSVIFISNDICTEKEIEELAAIFTEWTKEKHLANYTQIMLLYNPDIEELNPDKYSDYYSGNNIKVRLTCHVRSDGRITITNDKLYY